MEICGKNFRTFERIDFKIIAFEGRSKCFFVPYPARLADFDSRWHKNLNYIEWRFLRFIMCRI
jgi:hypothetical protein